MKAKATPLSLKEARITHGFWRDFMEKARTQVIPYQWEALNDRIEGAEPSYCMRNFRIASGKEKGEFGGFVFQDSDLAKWLEAVAYSLMWHPDPKLEQTVDGAIDEIVAAQQPDGYLNTYYIINGLDKRFTNLKDNHELYCLGHFLEAGVAYYKATGKDKLLKALVKYVDLVDSLIGPEEGKLHGYPGHQEIELALVKLYAITKDEKHLRLAKYFVDERGKEPLFFREETEKYNNYYPWEKSLFQYAYYQASEPVRDQQYAVGHSVRATYMYAGMADVAVETGDTELLDACLRLWKDVTRRQMYITGGIGSSHYGEAFTYSYDLPNDTIYAETCASIALVFFAQRMFNISPNGEYADVLEQALYNGIISGMSVDGKSFFYVNPLEVVPEATVKDQLRSHVKIERQKWFGCSCCPPNIARLLSSLSAYAYSTDKDCFYINLFVGGSAQTKLDSGDFDITVETKYPWEGAIAITINKAPAQAELAVRIPGWCENYTLQVNGTAANCKVKDGYARLTGLSPGEKIILILDMPAVFWEANPRVREDIGKVALKRGPMVYCLEEVDNGSDLHRVFVEKGIGFKCHFDEKFFDGAVVIQSPGKRLKQDAWDADTLYRKTDYGADYEEVSLRWVPYYLWANRGAGEMTTWVRTV
jgi:DUF1680 family protein